MKTLFKTFYYKIERKFHKYILCESDTEIVAKNFQNAIKRGVKIDIVEHNEKDIKNTLDMPFLEIQNICQKYNLRFGQLIEIIKKEDWFYASNNDILKLLNEFLEKQTIS